MKMEANRFRFRAWSPEDSWIIGPCGFEGFSNGYLDFSGRELSELVIMQSTGLLDMNGKEIFEGDIIAWKYEGKTIGDPSPVIWIQANAMFETEETLNGFDDVHCGSYEIIGNIYEHPNLSEPKP